MANFTARAPVTRRMPITKELLAVKIVQQKASEEEKRLFHDLIINLIRKNAIKYCATSMDELNDLIQDCFLQVWQYLHTFNPKKAHLSTWVWIVCRSVLNQNFADTCHYRNHVHSLKGDFDFSKRFRQSQVVNSNMDVRQIINQLYEHCSCDYHDILKEMFGDETCLMISEKIIIADVARRTKRNYIDVSRFFNHTVRPFLRKRLGSKEI